jgi:enamine deaminase RidA (YjgF/YER057c/UK114 family)
MATERTLSDQPARDVVAGEPRMSEITRIASQSRWEPIFGFSRAVRTDNWVVVSGTTAFDERGTIVGKNQMYVQARQVIANIGAALERTGMTLSNVVRTRVFVTDITRFAEVARAHQESFGSNPPASTVVEVRALVHPDMLVEIEADAYDAPLVADARASATKTRAAVSPPEPTASKVRVSAKSAPARKSRPARKPAPAKPRKRR